MTDVPDAPPALAPSRRRIAIILVGLAISVVFVYLGFRKVDLAEVGRVIGGANASVLALAVVAKLIAFGFSSIRTHLLAAPIGTFGLTSIFRSILLAFTANNILPFRTGDLIRIDYLARAGSASRSSCLAVVLLERLLDSFVLLALFISTIAAAAVQTSLLRPLIYIGLTFSVAMGGAIWISRRPDLFATMARAITAPLGSEVTSRLARHVQTFASGLAGLHSLARVAGAVGATAGFWLMSLASIKVWFWAFELALPWYAPLLVLGFVAFGMALPASPGHIGTYHYFVILALTAVGVDALVARSVAIVGHAVAFVPLTLAGTPLLVAYVLDARKRRHGAIAV